MPVTNATAAARPTAAQVSAYRTLMSSIDRTDAQLKSLARREASLAAKLGKRGIDMNDMENWDLIDGSVCQVRRVYSRTRRCMVTEVV